MHLQAETGARRVPPPLRFGAALLCIVSGLASGRDVGLAKSGFRPTSLGGHACEDFHP
jgi:hypothetical protein